MTLRYQILFSIEVLHDYFGSGKWKEVLFVPLPETVRILKESGCLLRQVENQLLVVARLDAAKKPVSLPDLFTRFSFMLQPQSPNYVNFTNLPLPEAGLKCFWFSNLKGNSAGSVHYLSAPIASYSNASSYQPGEFAKGTNGKTYEAIKVNNGAQQPNNSQAAKNFWVLHEEKQLVSGQDTVLTEAGETYPIVLAGAFHTMTAAAPATAYNVTVYAYQASTGSFTKKVAGQHVSFSEPHDQVPVDLRTLPAGLYKVAVNAEAHFVYYPAEAEVAGTPMFLDLYHLPDDQPLSFLKPDGTLKNIKFTLHFGSRRVYWRYKTRTEDIDIIHDSSGEFAFQPDGLRQFISLKPIPLSDMPRKTLSGKTGNLVIASPLPSPRGDRLLDKHEELFTTETFINF